MKLRPLATAVILSAAAGAPTFAAVHTLTAILNRAQQVMPPSSNVPAGAGGIAVVLYDDSTNTIDWALTWTNLSGPAAVIHIHGPAGPGQQGGSFVDIGSRSGLNSPATFTGHQINPLFGPHFLNGLTYIDIHTSANQGGEIRGQLRVAGSDPFSPVVPDPGSGALGIWSFTGVPGSGMWFDPIAATGYLYKTTDGLANFTSVTTPSSLPDNNGTYVITHGSTSVTLAAGATYTFPSPVSQFTVTDILPTVDGEDPFAFPSFLTFDQETVSFTMAAIPEPAAGCLVPVTLAAASRRRRTRAKEATR